MINENYYKTYGNQNYIKLLDKKRESQLTAIAFTTSSTALTGFKPDLFPISALVNAFLISRMIFYSKNDLQMYTKETLDIKNAYNEILNNYTELNKEFGMKEPIEIFSLFLYALNNGYLSKDKMFTRGKCGIEDIETIYGAVPITGKGECRHIASMLKNIFQKSNIESSTQIVFQDFSHEYENDVLIEMMRTMDTLSFEELKENRQLIEQRFKNKIENINNMQDKSKRSGNHALTLAFSNGIVHIYDATLEKIYKTDKLDKNILMDMNSNKARVIYNKRSFIGTKEEYKKNKDYLAHPTSDIEYETNLISIYMQLFKSNKDLFEKMYQENKELYDEICDKISVYKKENYGTKRCNIYR